MRFHVIRLQAPNPAQSPLRVIEHEAGREVGWVNRFLDREYVRRLADATLRSCAYALLHFVRWWESLHHTGDVVEGNLTKSTLLDYLKFQCSKLKTERMVPVDSLVVTVTRRLRFFRFLDPRPPDGRLLARRSTRDALVRQLRRYLHQVCHSLGLSTRIVPHQLRHTYATEMLRAGVSFPALMKLLGHTSPDMTMLYVEVALNDLQREFQQARSKPRHLVPQPKTSFALTRTGLDGVIDSLQAAQHALEMFRRALPIGAARSCLDRLSNRLTKIATEARKLGTP